MKLRYKITGLALIGVTSFFTSCQDPDYLTPDTSATAANLSANFLFVNASPDAPSLDLFVNNLMSGTSVTAGVAQGGYTKLSIPSNGLANLNVRAKATSGSIGGALGSNDLIFRAANNSQNNFSASDSAYYTFIAVDSITRPLPIRTNNALGIGDTTYFNPLAGKYIPGVERAPLPAAQKNKTVSIGTVPLGATDPGGLRFLVITDQVPLPGSPRFPKPSATQAAVRFINASPNSGNTAVTVSVGAFNLNTTGATAQGIFVYPLSFASIANTYTGFNPSVGSRSLTANVYGSFTVAAPVSVVVRQSATEIARLDNVTFQGGGVYTIILSGNRRTTPLSLTIVKNK